MDGEPIAIQIGRIDEGVLIRVLGRMHVGAEDFDDGNWLITPVQVRAGGFGGRVGADLRAEEIKQFRVGLEQMYREIKGEAVLSSLDGWISLTVTCLPNGSLDVRGVLNDRPGVGNQLDFRIPDLDQSDLPPLIASLEACEQAFPVLGQRHR